MITIIKHQTIQESIKPEGDIYGVGGEWDNDAWNFIDYVLIFYLIKADLELISVSNKYA